MVFDEGVIERNIPRQLLISEGYAVITHMLADAIELWAKDCEEVDRIMVRYAEGLRKLAGNI